VFALITSHLLEAVEVYRCSDGWNSAVYGPKDIVRLESVGAEMAVAAIYA